MVSAEAAAADDDPADAGQAMDAEDASAADEDGSSQLSEQGADEPAPEPKKRVPVYRVIGRRGLTTDVLLPAGVSFERLGLSRHILNGLQAVGYQAPSPIQLKAIPIGIAGRDMVVQSKAGTGKTCVLSVVALSAVNVELNEGVQVLILTSTSEICIQIFYTIQAIGQFVPNLRCAYAVGGSAVQQNVRCMKEAQIVVGTVGRVCQMIKTNSLKVDLIKLLILDEVDKLQEESMLPNFNWVYNNLRRNKQVITVSATYQKNVRKCILPYMRDPEIVRLDKNEHQLIGVKSYVLVNYIHNTSTMNAKMNSLLHILTNVQFDQCVVFCNYQTRVDNVAKDLHMYAIYAQRFTGHMVLSERLEVLGLMNEKQCRVLIATDAISRGIDLPSVDLVINFDVPIDFQAYLHRAGRAGRFGTYGAVVTLISGRPEAEAFCKLALKAKFTFKIINTQPPKDLTCNSSYYETLPSFVHDERAASYVWTLLLLHNQKLFSYAKFDNPPESIKVKKGFTSQETPLNRPPPNSGTVAMLSAYCTAGLRLCHSFTADIDCAEGRQYSFRTCLMVLKKLLANGFPEIEVSNAAVVLKCSPPAVNGRIKKGAVEAAAADRAESTENSNRSEPPTTNCDTTTSVESPVLLNNDSSETSATVETEERLDPVTECSHDSGDQPATMAELCHRYSVLLDRYESLLDRYERHLDTPADRAEAPTVVQQRYVAHMAKFMNRM